MLIKLTFDSSSLLFPWKVALALVSLNCITKEIVLTLSGIDYLIDFPISTSCQKDTTIKIKKEEIQINLYELMVKYLHLIGGIHFHAWQAFFQPSIYIVLYLLVSCKLTNEASGYRQSASTPSYCYTRW